MAVLEEVKLVVWKIETFPTAAPPASIFMVAVPDVVTPVEPFTVVVAPSPEAVFCITKLLLPERVKLPVTVKLYAVAPLF